MTLLRIRHRWLSACCLREQPRRLDVLAFSASLPAGLRRPPLHAMPRASLEAWVGREVACSGFIVDHVLLAERIEAVDGAV